MKIFSKNLALDASLALKIFLLPIILCFISSCESIKSIPTVSNSPKPVERVSSREELTFEPAGYNLNNDKVDVNFQIRNEDGKLFEITSVDDVVSKVEVKQDGKWVEVDLDEMKLKPSSIQACNPQDYCIILDLSGSMFKNKETIFKEVTNFIEKKNEKDNVGIIKYGTFALIASEYSDNKAELKNSLFNKSHDTLSKGTNTPRAYQLFLDELYDHPNEDLKVIIFSDWSGFYASNQLEPLFEKAYADSIQTHRVIYKRKVIRKLYTKKSKKRILDSYDFKYGTSFIVQSFTDIEKYLNNILVEECLTNSIELPLYQKGDNEYRVHLKLRDRTVILEQTIDNNEQAVDENSTFSLETTNLLDIQFNTGSDELLPKSLVEIEKVKKFLMTHAGVKIKIQGHTDNQGSESYNMELSQKRSEAVKKKLIEWGIESARLEAEGYGFSRPIASNDTPEGRQKNRRTEFIVLN